VHGPAKDNLAMNRRHFVQTAASVAALALSPSTILQAQPRQRLLLGLDTYSIRGLKWKAPRILEYAASLKLDAVMLSPPTFEGTNDAYFKKLGEQASDLGIKIEPAFSAICDLSKSWKPKEQGDPVRYLLQCIQRTKLLGANTFRTLMGTSDDRERMTPIEAMMESTIKNLRGVRSQAMDAGVRIAIENHGDMQARQVKTLIEEAGKEFVGSCFDAGNPVRMLEDPVAVFEILGPYTFASHMRDSMVYEHPRGAAYQWVAMGDGMIDFKRLVGRYAELCPKAVFYLEIITGRRAEVLPYLEPDFWKVFPKVQATDFAQFLALARKGQPFMGNMLIAGDGKQPPEYEAALLQQQRIDSERSLEYCKQSLDVGVKWKQ
jgi:3-oxoisoapionate decarboxylase